jgi:hypothetical protein
MIDGAALGTLRIGLDQRIASEWPDPTHHRTARRTRVAHPTFRARLATTLRSVADRLDRTPAPALEPST